MLRAALLFLSVAGICNGQSVGAAQDGLFKAGFDGPCAACTVQVSVTVPGDFAPSTYISSLSDDHPNAKNLPVLRDLPSIVGAISVDSSRMALFAVSRGTYDRYGGESAEVALSFQTTAEALVFLTVGIYASEPDAADESWRRIHDDSSVQALSVWLAAHPTDESLDSAEFRQTLASAIDSVAGTFKRERNKATDEAPAVGNVTPWEVYSFPRENTEIDIQSVGETVTAALETKLGSSLYRSASVEVVPPPESEIFFSKDGFTDPALITPQSVGHATSPVLTAVVLEENGLAKSYLGIDAIVASLVSNYAGNTVSVDLGSNVQKVVQIRSFSGARESTAETALIDSSPTWRRGANEARGMNLIAGSLELFAALISYGSDSTVRGCVVSESASLFADTATGVAILGIEDATKAVVRLTADLLGGVAECAAPVVGRILKKKLIERLLPVYDLVVELYEAMSSAAQAAVLSERIRNFVTQPSVDSIYVARSPDSSIVGGHVESLEAQHNDGEEFWWAGAHYIFDFSPVFAPDSYLIFTCDPGCPSGNGDGEISANIEKSDQTHGRAFWNINFTAAAPSQQCGEVEFYRDHDLELPLPVVPALNEICFPVFDPGALELSLGDLPVTVIYENTYVDPLLSIPLTSFWPIPTNFRVVFNGWEFFDMQTADSPYTDYTYHRESYLVCGETSPRTDLSDYFYDPDLGAMFYASGVARLTKLEDFDTDHSCWQAYDSFEFPFVIRGYRQSEILTWTSSSQLVRVLGSSNRAKAM